MTDGEVQAILSSLRMAILAAQQSRWRDRRLALERAMEVVEKHDASRQG